MPSTDTIATRLANPCGATAPAALVAALTLASATNGAAPAVAGPADGSPLDRLPQPWQRRADPILSARATEEEWCRVVCYSPHVIHHDGRFRMWYLGTSTGSPVPAGIRSR